MQTHIFSNALSYRAMQLYALFLFIFMLLGTGFASLVNERLTLKYTAWINATVNINIEGTAAHLWFEEIISGDEGQDIQRDVWHHLDQAEAYARNMLDGGEFNGNLFSALDAATARQTTEDLLLNLAQFRMIAEERYHLYQSSETANQSAAGSQLDQQFDAVFNAFIADSNAVSQHVQQIMQHEFQTFKFVQYGLGALLLLIFISIILLLQKHEQQRQRSEVKMELLARFPEENPNPVLFINMQHHISYANPAGIQLLNEVGLAMHDIAPGTWLAHCERARHQQGEHEIELELASKYYQLYFQGTQSDDVHIYGRNISALKESQQEHAKLISLIENTTDLIAMATSDGFISYMNSAGRKLLGVALDEDLSRKRIADFHTPIENERIRTTMMPTAIHDGFWRGESPFLHRDGSEIAMSIVLMCNLDADKNPDYFALIARDIREEKDMQSKIEHTQRLESLGVLAGGIAHDFNNILTAIMGNAGLAGRRLEDTHPAKEHLTRIINASDKAADLCKQMLAYSGKGRFIIKSINVATLVNDMITLLEVSISKNVVIRYDLFENIPYIEADVAQIQQVVMNLITNANEAIDGHSGVITIVTSVFHADHAYLSTTFTDEHVEEGQFVSLEVTDNGCGMDKATIQKIFDPFFTTKFTGRGLGMSAVLGIIRGHKGALKVYSEPGRGTTFKILLPAAADQEITISTTPTPLPAPTWSPSGTALVVDDEEAIRDTAAAILRDMGFAQVLTANNGLEGVEVYKKHHETIDFVLLDMTMPKLDGEGTFRELRRINPDVKVILSSGYNEQEATQRFTGKGLAGFIQKPYLPDGLQQLLRSIL